MTDSLTIVLQLTGLLMIVPPNVPGGPTHVLMPVPEHLPHAAIIGFRRNGSEQHCSGWSTTEFCFVEMEGWQLDPLPGSAGGANPAAGPLPRGILDLTHGSGGRRVHAGHTGNSPGRDTLHSRVTLPSGSVTATCPMGRWIFDPVGLPPADTFSLSNVVTWTIPNVRQDSIVLRRRPLRGHPGGPQTLATLGPDSLGRIELLVAHVPPQAWSGFRSDLLRGRTTSSPARGRMAVARDRSARGGAAASDTSTVHFVSYYRLLTGAKLRPPPSLETVLRPNGCPMQIWPEFATVRSPTTVNCMVVSGSQ